MMSVRTATLTATAAERRDMGHERCALSRDSKRPGFSLIELVIVVVILAIIAAIAIPRLTNTAASAGDAALVADLAMLRQAIAMYEADHHGSLPDTTLVAQLTQFTDIGGDVSAVKDATHIYGPYLLNHPDKDASPG